MAALFPFQQAVGIRFGNVVEVAANDHRTFYAVDGLAQYLHVFLAFLESGRQFFADVAFQLTVAFFGRLDRADVGHNIALLRSEHERKQVHVDERETVPVDVELIESVEGLDLLDEKTKLVAIYRLKYREASLFELSEIISLETSFSITKSGLHHKFKKIKDLANKIRIKVNK